MKQKILLFISAILFLSIQSALALPVEWQFFNDYGTSGNTNVGTSVAYFDETSTYSLTAYGYDNGLDANILENNRGNNEQGLGISGNGFAEINKNEILKIDLGGNYLSMTNWSINFNSVDGKENALLFVSNNGTIAGNTFTLLSPDLDLNIDQSVSNTWLSFTADAQYLFIMEDYAATDGLDGRSGDDVLVKGLKAEVAPVPEPATLLLLGGGLAGLALYRRKQKKS